MKPFIAVLVLVFTPFAPASAQAPGNGVSANVNINKAAIDPQRLASLRCKLGTVNPRACVQQPSPSQRPTASSGRGNRTGVASGARRP